ncbi:hexosaminidase D isoform X2 [Leguminivora glycinivorella]|uniref:hexosaminidase D isoform X2 n=1 Tax=Leguminivora glycinivorella TaxID=1035111 RepID=UPI00200E025D|nr:hexosaminidase D isoform X2 [Leguminivora glycinivorella]
MHRIVHLDLKGAPFQVHYLEKVILSVKSWGATGILLEWEDTFPYSAALADIGSVRGSGGDGMYSMEEVRHLLRFIQEHGLEPIQLIQTIGHMEFVLKHPAYHSLRELPRSPAVLCPSRPESLQLVKMMLEQTLDAQPTAEYLHIGADEVWHTGICADCQNRAANNIHSTASLYLEHIRELALFLKQRRPNLTVLMWDDMLRSVKVDTLIAYQLGELVQPVVWQYNALEHFHLDPALWERYRQVFPRLWAGSAFKGANGSCQILSPVRRYVSNQEAWRLEVKKYGHSISFAGVILTGWSRFDHYATLCELLPVALPSLASCLKVWTVDDLSIDTVVSEVLPPEQWPGSELAQCVHSFVVLRDRANSLLHGDLVKTWLNPWQVENGYINPVQVEGLAMTVQQLKRKRCAEVKRTRNSYEIKMDHHNMI